ncbi:hypothetical protein MNB_SV-8-226 [hydrothermal vent metagenome]|uniref:Uncharacterized protein n=1 Tax=hydrothermal vent metagenome TaxID=652676 RepID=A0A1W1BZI8_9ZZZZ
MSKDNKNESKVEVGLEGANIPTMQKIPTGGTSKHGANIPKMQPSEPTETSSSDKKEQ